MKFIILFLCTLTSFSLFSQIPSNGEPWYPTPLAQPKPKAAKDPSLINRPIYNNTDPLEEIALDRTMDQLSNDSNRVAGNPGILPSIKDLEDLIKGPLAQVPNPEVYPARVNVRLISKYGAAPCNPALKNCWLCSGTLIDSRHIATAGHCLYKDSIGWADTVFVEPAYDSDNQGSGKYPFGQAIGAGPGSMIAWTNWIEKSS